MKKCLKIEDADELDEIQYILGLVYVIFEDMPHLILQTMNTIYLG